MGNCNNLLHAEHNEKACHYLNHSDEFRDWVISTAFYSALHYVRSMILPYKVVDNGKTKTIPDFESLYSFLKKGTQTKHRFLIHLIEHEHSDISDDYSNLFDLAYKARYLNYIFDKSISDLAIKRLKNIKEYCK